MWAWTQSHEHWPRNVKLLPDSLDEQIKVCLLAQMFWENGFQWARAWECVSNFACIHHNGTVMLEKPAHQSHVSPLLVDKEPAICYFNEVSHSKCFWQSNLRVFFSQGVTSTIIIEVQNFLPFLYVLTRFNCRNAASSCSWLQRRIIRGPCSPACADKMVQLY